MPLNACEMSAQLQFLRLANTLKKKKVQKAILRAFGAEAPHGQQHAFASKEANVTQAISG